MLISLLSLLFFFSSHAHEPDAMRVGYIPTAPLVYVGHNNKLTGITYDLVQSFLREADIFKVTYVAFSDKKSATEALEAGDIQLFLGNLGDDRQTNIVSTTPYMIDGLYSLPLPQTFISRLGSALNWQDLAINTFLFFTATSSLCAFLLTLFDTHHQNHLRFQSFSAVFFSQLYTLFSSFNRNLLSTPLSPAGRVITATWTVLLGLSTVFLTSVVTCALISSLTPTTQPALSLSEISGQRVGLLEDGFGTAFALSTTSSLHQFTDTRELVDALKHNKIDYALVSGAFFTHSLLNTRYGRDANLANTPLTLNPLTIALNKDFANTILFEETKLTYAAYFNNSITHALHSLHLYHLCTRYLKTPYLCVF